MNSQIKIDYGPLLGYMRSIGKTQKELANYDGRSLTSINNILRGKTEMSWSTIVRWSEFLGIEIGSPEFARIFFSIKN